MAPKRVLKSVKTLKKSDYSALNIKDVLCPICRSILVEPVTLPCDHEFCLCCFNGTMENANLVCPLCRIRVGSWLRKAKKEGKLINYVLWDAIKNKFPQQIKNKMNGIDDNMEEVSEIVVSYPGEIRKEYEMQKQKEEEEFRKKCEADLKASEDLIRKIREEEDYERTVMEEKLKLDENVAKKLAQELAVADPSTSKVNQVRMLGPMDKFLKQNNVSQNTFKKKLNDFASKEYTCKILCVDNKKNSDDVSHKMFSPILPKKIQQLQKVTDTDVTSDGSDCIESELRYFKPIDYRTNPPSAGKPAIKVPTKKPFKSTSARIVSPTGLINFYSNFLESAFARISFSKSVDADKRIEFPISISDTNTAYTTSTINGGVTVTTNLKRMHSQDDLSTLKRKVKTESSNEEVEEEESPVINNFSNAVKKKRLFGKLNHIATENNMSPPFLGFENNFDSDTTSKATNNNTNGVSDIVDDEHSKRLLQEMADLEFAKKLQEELNRDAHNTRSSRRNTRNSKRQTTLDEIMKTPYRVK
ncbi:hypothetical protein NQ315_003412 [Exocentrus adspersus]|uniref:RING-type E3 ubiquitin transferase n=1 Tax=Exocentrus adspersus TaxID=1586481 RepID=A0AAV8VMZ6_9CUCU|nr:hypothetical protein NQ315_003412 [Exocentrus adspersus]